MTDTAATELITYHRAGKLLGVCTKTVRNRVAAEKIDAPLINRRRRLTYADLEAITRPRDRKWQADRRLKKPA